jgi:SH3-like domain-containing protein
MKQTLFFLFSLLLWASLSACSPTRVEPTPIAVAPTLLIPTVETTAVPFPTATMPTSTATAVPERPNPILTTQGNTHVRLGPGATYGVASVLAAGVTTPIVGKNLDGTWWFIANHGLGVNGWVSAAVVKTEGDTGDVPFMAAPTLTPTPNLPTPNVPVMGNTGPPPGGDICVAAHPGPGPNGPIYLHQLPADTAAVTAALGLNRWAAIKDAQGSWYRLEDLAGLSGWAHQSDLAFTCPPPETKPQRIQFAPGETSITLEEMLDPPQRVIT